MFPVGFGAALLTVIAFVPQIRGQEGFVEPGDYLIKTVAALSHLTWFLQHRYEEGNLDLFIGTRIAEGQLSTVISHVNENPSSVDFLNRTLVERIKVLRDHLDSVTEKGILLVAATQPAYYKRSGGLLKKGFWDIDYSTLRKINRTLITGSERKETIKEAQSDDCIKHMLINSSASVGGCVISDSCWTLITAPRFYGYSLTHQIFLLEIAKKAGYMDELERHAEELGTSLADLSDSICANVYGQAEEIADSAFPLPSHDIFMEQIVLCGILGYEDFFKGPWLDKILDWQMPQGCYGVTATTNLRTTFTTIGRSEKKIEMQQRLVESQHMFRTKREEKPMNDGCYNHQTAVAAAALAAYIKFLVLFSNGTL